MKDAGVSERLHTVYLSALEVFISKSQVITVLLTGNLSSIQ